MLRQNSIQKIIQNNFCMVNSIQTSIQHFEISWIQFNKIFIQFENVGIDHGYSGPMRALVTNVLAYQKLKIEGVIVNLLQNAPQL